MHLEAAFSLHFLSKEKFTKTEIYLAKMLG